jgi:hypothetical protein
VEKNKPQKPSSYEDNYGLIHTEISKRRPKWFLTSVAWMDFDDVKQIILMHIYKKWDQWDQSRPLKPWVNKIVTNQMKNILRNNYSNFMRPCLNCPFNSSGDGVEGSLCGFTKSGVQDGSCPLFRKWEKTKKAAYDIKMAVSLDSHTHEVGIGRPDADIIVAEKKLHKEMKKQLGDRQFKVYKMLFIDNLDEEEVARVMGYKTTESGRRAGYKQIKNLKKQFKDRAKHILNNKDIFIYGKGV